MGASVYRRTTIATLFALLLGSGITVLLHEGAHWITGAAFGVPGRLYSFAVDHESGMTPVQTAITALAGPALSLVLGLIMTTWLPFRHSAGIGHLLWLFVGFTSLEEAVTYLVITMFGAGDTATAAAALGLDNAAVMIGTSAVGIAGMFWAAWRFAPHVRRHAGEDIRLARSLAWYPWLISVVWLIVLQTGQLLIVPAGLSVGEFILILLSSYSITLFAPMSFIFLRRTKADPQPLHLPAVPTVLIVGYAVLFVLNIVLDLTGPTLG